MKGSIKLGIGIGLLAAVGAVIYVSKPDPQPAVNPVIAERKARQERANRALSELPEGAKLAIDQRAENFERFQREMEKAQTDTEGKGADHKSAGHLAKGAKSAKLDIEGLGIGSFEPANRIPGETRWAEPSSVTFEELRKIYIGFRLGSQMGGDFKPQMVQRLHGAAITLKGAVMPIDEIPEDGRLKRFWLVNPNNVMAGCVFCNSPTMGDIVYVSTTSKPVKVSTEELYSKVFEIELTGQFELGPSRTGDGLEYLYGLKLR